MIKILKVKKQLRLDELIKYAWDNQLNKTFTSDKGLKKVIITQSSIDFRSLDNGIISYNDTFTVSVGIPITEDTSFNSVVIVVENRINHMPSTKQYSIRSIRRNYPTVKEIHTLINGRLELIWEDEVDE